MAKQRKTRSSPERQGTRCASRPVCVRSASARVAVEQGLVVHLVLDVDHGGIVAEDGVRVVPAHGLLRQSRDRLGLLDLRHGIELDVEMI